MAHDSNTNAQLKNLCSTRVASKCGEMWTERGFRAWTGFALLFAFMSFAGAEEKPSPLLTALSSTTISGYVNPSAHWDPMRPAAYPADAVCPIRFHDLVDVLVARGFALQISATGYTFHYTHYTFHHPQIAETISFRRTGPFATMGQIIQLRAYVARHHL